MIETNTALAWREWADHAEETSALTIGDVKKMKWGEELKVLILDRNVWDIALSERNNKPDVKVRPDIFFRYNSGTYIHDQDLRGKLRIAAIPNSYDFEFHLFLPSEQIWYPLQDGYIPSEDSQGAFSFDSNVVRHWSSFPDTTQVGYRGAMIPWTKLSNMPSIFYVDSS